MSQLRGIDLGRIFLDAFEAEARSRTGSPYGWVSAPKDPALIAGVEAVRDAIAEHHRAQWSDLVEQGREVVITPKRWRVGDNIGFTTIEILDGASAMAALIAANGHQAGFSIEDEAGE